MYIHKFIVILLTSFSSVFTCSHFFRDEYETCNGFQVIFRLSFMFVFFILFMMQFFFFNTFFYLSDKLIPFSLWTKKNNRNFLEKKCHDDKQEARMHVWKRISILNIFLSVLLSLLCVFLSMYVENFFNKLHRLMCVCCYWLLQQADRNRNIHNNSRIRMQKNAYFSVKINKMKSFNHFHMCWCAHIHAWITAPLILYGKGFKFLLAVESTCLWI
jgi:hypothetical protein